MTNYEILKDKILDVESSLISIQDPYMREILKEMKADYIELALKEIRKDANKV